MNLSATLTLSIACLLTFSQSFAATEKVYKWTDAKGQTHYSQRPPFNTETEVIKPPTGHSDPVEYKTAPEPSNPTEAKVATNAPLKDKERCDSARKAAETLKIHARVRIQDDKGEFHYMSPEEHQEKVKEANQAIKESCS